MTSEFLIAVLAGLGGMLGWGFADFFAKKTIDEIGDIATLAWAHIFGTLGLIAFAIYQYNASARDFFLPDTGKLWLLLAFFGVFQAVVYILVYKGFGKGQVAVLAPVFSSFSGITALFSILFFGEVVRGNVLVALVIVFAGILLINLDLKGFREKRFGFMRVDGFKEVALATVFAALWTLLWDKFLGGQDWLSYSLFMYAFMTVYIWIVCYVQKIKVFFDKSHVWKFLALIGLCEIVAYLSISLGYSMTTQTSVIALLSGAFSLPTIILARAFLKEQTTRTQTLGTLVIIAGIMILAMLK